MIIIIYIGQACGQPVDQLKGGREGKGKDGRSKGGR